MLINGELWLAKFPKPVGDEWDLMGWEYTLNRLGADLGIIVPQARLLKITDINSEDRHIYVARRFDRLQDSRQRIPYISAMTALEASDGDGGDWVDVVEYAREEGADTEQLWKRAMLGVLVGNTDDHLRNHGFLRFGREWGIAPCFDMNPTPDGDTISWLSSAIPRMNLLRLSLKIRFLFLEYLSRMRTAGCEPQLLCWNVPRNALAAMGWMRPAPL